MCRSIHPIDRHKATTWPRRAVVATALLAIALCVAAWLGVRVKREAGELRATERRAKTVAAIARQLFENHLADSLAHGATGYRSPSTKILALVKEVEADGGRVVLASDVAEEAVTAVILYPPEGFTFLCLKGRPVPVAYRFPMSPDSHVLGSRLTPDGVLVTTGGEFARFASIALCSGLGLKIIEEHQRVSEVSCGAIVIQYEYVGMHLTAR